MRLLFTGGRDYKRYSAFVRHVNTLLKMVPLTAVAHGDCPTGLDALADSWACKNYKWALTRYPADWNKHGKKAGMLRNIEMIDKFKPWVVMAFPGGKGTAHCVNYAVKRNIKLIVVPDYDLIFSLYDYFSRKLKTFDVKDIDERYVKDTVKVIVKYSYSYCLKHNIGVYDNKYPITKNEILRLYKSTYEIRDGIIRTPLYNIVETLTEYIQHKKFGIYNNTKQTDESEIQSGKRSKTMVSKVSSKKSGRIRWK